MFTICFVLFTFGHSLPSEVECRYGSYADVQRKIADCKVIDAHDPIFTCKAVTPRGSRNTIAIEMTDVTGESGL